MRVSTRIDCKGILRGGVLRRFRALLRILAVLAGLLAVVFALSNRDLLQIQFLPLPFTVEAPVYLVLMCMLFFGVVVGGVGVWFSSLEARSIARERVRRVKWLEAKLEEEKKLRHSSLREAVSKRPEIPSKTALKSSHPHFYPGGSS